MAEGEQEVREALEEAEEVLESLAYELKKKKITNVVGILSGRLRNLIDEEQFHQKLCYWFTGKNFDPAATDVTRKAKEAAHKLYGKAWNEDLKAKIYAAVREESAEILQNHGIADQWNLADAVFGVIRAQKQVRLTTDAKVEIK